MVEGPSYSERFGQIALEQQRLGFYEGARELGYDVSYVAPKTPRKICLGNGNLKAKDLWLEINGNGAAAGLIALYGGGYKYTKEEHGR